MEMPQVSIITPAFNCEGTIQKTYESIKKQTYGSWEWLVIEDHSTDGSLDVVTKIANGDDRVVLLRTRFNSGAAVARNLGIERARGRYIAFLDADDLWKEDKLRHQIFFMETNGHAFTYTNYDLLYPTGKTKKYRVKYSIIDYKRLLKSGYIGCLTVIYDTQQLGKVYMPLDCEKREDHGAWLDILKTGINAYGLDEYLSIYRIGEKTASSNKLKMIKYQYHLYKHHEKFNFCKALWFTLVCSLNKVFNKY